MSFPLLDCSTCLDIDGHMKGARAICRHTDGVVISCEEIESVNLGCNQTPIKGSYMCINHQDTKKDGKV